MFSARRQAAASTPFAGVSDSRVFLIGAGVILLIGTAFRFWNITEPPLWMDEAVAVAFARLPAGAILFDKIDNHPPLFYFILHLWQFVFSEPVMARVPAALAGIATIGVAMLMMRDLVSLRASLMAGLLLALSTPHIYFSQEARMYTLLILGMTVAAWGALGHASPGRLTQRGYAALYVIGGILTIYSHTIGLVMMFCIGMAGLAGGLVTGAGMAHARSWFMRNLVLLAFSLPWLLTIFASIGNTGLTASTALWHSLWYFKTATAFPGIGDLDNLAALVLYGLVAFGIVWSWLEGRRALALMLFAMVALYPALLFIVSFERPLMAVRTMIPAVLGVCLAASVGFDLISRTAVRYASGAVIVSAALASSLYQSAHPMKPEDFGAAFAHIDAEGYGDAPVLNCIDLSSTAEWLAKPQADHYLQSRGGLLRFPGPQYWHAARMSMSRYARSTAADIDAYLGGGLLVEGGVEAAFAEEERVVFIRAKCADEDYDAIYDGLDALGFVLESETLMDERVAGYSIVSRPSTVVGLYRRAGETDPS